MKALLVALLICAGLPVQAGDKNQQDSTGGSAIEKAHYYGVGWQRDGQHWSIEVLVDEAGGQIAYPSLDCTGTWTLKSKSAEYVEYIEQILQGVEDCVELGIVRLESLENGNLVYTWFETEAAVEARAVLLPSGDTRLTYMQQLMLTLNNIDTDFMFPEYIE